MNPTLRFAIAAAALLIAVAAPIAVQASGPKVLKIATIAPRGSLYHRVLQDMGESFARARGRGARAIVYPNSIQGTEADTVRRMRVGQLDGSMLSIVGLSQIDRSVAALQFMPMMFRSWDELDHVREQLRPDLEARLEARGFRVLIWGEAGWVQFFTKEPMTAPAQFKHARIWAWSEDHTQIDLMKSLGYHPVGLPIADILPALETGIIDTVPVAPMWALVGQFDRITRHMLPVNWVPIVGATVLRKETFDAFSPEVRAAVLDAAQEAELKLREHRTVQDRETVEAMQARGLIVQPLTGENERAWRAVAEAAWPKVRGTMVPEETFDRVRAILDAYRKRSR